MLTSDKPYAPIQQFGGTVTAGGGKLGARMLAIPLNDKARRMLSKMGASTSLRSQDLTLIRTKGGKLLLARTFKYKKMRLSKAERGTARRRGIRTRRTQRKPEFLFVLKESVTLAPNPPPRGYAPRADEPEYQDFVAKELGKHLREG